MKALLLTLLVGATFCSEAGTIYKSVDAKGRLIYSDEPIRGARIVKRFEAPAERGARGPIAPESRGEVARAERALAEAERALQEGRKPLPHERKATGNEGSQLSDGYFERVLALERAVERARMRLQSATAQFN